jgi:hypothetical protein
MKDCCTHSLVCRNYNAAYTIRNQPRDSECYTPLPETFKLILNSSNVESPIENNIRNEVCIEVCDIGFNAV